ncbi:hypothetical protein HK097_005625 [Rhizophlyctis rosea]|uniref:Uncharacterized protein n=1 Tax=Rhizophlyctis rosea TaxID=64517 RepID=A0AAD5X344_9FUNG|nr:hypothetical protein HK097_005625 [Rhizophlyctis rosea]
MTAQSRNGNASASRKFSARPSRVADTDHHTKPLDNTQRQNDTQPPLFQLPPFTIQGQFPRPSLEQEHSSALALQQKHIQAILQSVDEWSVEMYEQSLEKEKQNALQELDEQEFALSVLEVNSSDESIRASLSEHRVLIFEQAAREWIANVPLSDLAPWTSTFFAWAMDDESRCYRSVINVLGLSENEMTDAKRNEISTFLNHLLQNLEEYSHEAYELLRQAFQQVENISDEAWDIKWASDFVVLPTPNSLPAQHPKSSQHPAPNTNMYLFPLNELSQAHDELKLLGGIHVEAMTENFQAQNRYDRLEAEWLKLSKYNRESLDLANYRSGQSGEDLENLTMQHVQLRDYTEFLEQQVLEQDKDLMQTVYNSLGRRIASEKELGEAAETEKQSLEGDIAALRRQLETARAVQRALEDKQSDTAAALLNAQQKATESERSLRRSEDDGVENKRVREELEAMLEEKENQLLGLEEALRVKDMSIFELREEMATQQLEHEIELTEQKKSMDAAGAKCGVAEMERDRLSSRVKHLEKLLASEQDQTAAEPPHEHQSLPHHHDNTQRSHNFQRPHNTQRQDGTRIPSANANSRSILPSNTFRFNSVGINQLRMGPAAVNQSSSYNREVREADRLLSTARQQIQQKDEEIRKLQGELTTANGHWQNFRTKAKDLETQLKRKMIEYEELGKQFDKKKTQYENLQGERDGLLDSLETEQRRLASLRGELEELKNENNQMLGDLNARHDSRKGLDADLKRAQEELIQWKEKCSTLETNLELNEEELAELRADLETARNGTHTHRLDNTQRDDRSESPSPDFDQQSVPGLPVVFQAISEEGAPAARPSDDGLLYFGKQIIKAGSTFDIAGLKDMEPSMEDESAEMTKRLYCQDLKNIDWTWKEPVIAAATACNSICLMKNESPWFRCADLPNIVDWFCGRALARYERTIFEQCVVVAQAANHHIPFDVVPGKVRINHVSDWHVEHDPKAPRSMPRGSDESLYGYAYNPDIEPTEQIWFFGRHSEGVLTKAQAATEVEGYIPWIEEFVPKMRPELAHCEIRAIPICIKKRYCFELLQWFENFLNRNGICKLAIISSVDRLSIDGPVNIAILALFRNRGIAVLDCSRPGWPVVRPEDVSEGALMAQAPVEQQRIGTISTANLKTGMTKYVSLNTAY